jgi:ubiquinone/menaquinone biosynthesis C-methylase UbiE
MGIYRKFVVPRLTDLAMSNKRLFPYRQRTVAAAQGCVLEIGAGAGPNIKLYPATTLELIALEPDPALVQMARDRARGSGRPVTYIEASAERIPLGDHSVDTVVSTWTMCTIPDLRTALLEVHRVLKLQGKLLFVEHGLAPDAGVRKWQHRLDPLWSRIGGGCHLNRPIAALLENAGFKVAPLQTGYMSGPKVATFMYEGVASPL